MMFRPYQIIFNPSMDQHATVVTHVVLWQPLYTPGLIVVARGVSMMSYLFLMLLLRHVIV